MHEGRFRSLNFEQFMAVIEYPERIFAALKPDGLRLGVPSRDPSVD